MDREYFKPIPNYAGYYASQYGEIWSEESRRILKQRKMSDVRGGYYMVSVKLESGKYKQIGVHRLVALTYCRKKKHQDEVHHIDGDKGNNCADNLIWVSKAQHSKEHFETAADSPEAIRICLNCPKAECTPFGCKYLLGVRRITK